MSDQPKPTGKWTAAYVAGLAMKLGNAPQHVADDHNAALAASVLYWQGIATQEWHKGFAAGTEKIQQLRDQLAEERENCAFANSQWSRCMEHHETSRIGGGMSYQPKPTGEQSGPVCLTRRCEFANHPAKGAFEWHYCSTCNTNHPFPKPKPTGQDFARRERIRNIA